MGGSTKIRPGLCALALAISLLAAGSARAQLIGEPARGLVGLTAGTQPAAGILLTVYAHLYLETNQIDERGVPGPPSYGSGALTMLTLPALSLEWVAPWQLLGAHFATGLSIWFTTPRVEAWNSSVRQSGYAFGDVYIKPIEMGWHSRTADGLLNFGLYIPTGRYGTLRTEGNPNNPTYIQGSDTSLNQYAYEFSAGATFWFDAERHFNFAMQWFFDFYSAKVDHPDEYQTGSTLTMMGGLGYQFAWGPLNVGIPYFLQTKMANDRLFYIRSTDWSAGIGAEVDLHWSTSDNVDLRYLQGVGGRNTSNGATFFLIYNHLFAFGG